MKIDESNRITEATRAELLGIWLKKELDDFMEIGEFLEECRANGTVVVEEKTE